MTLFKKREMFGSSYYNDVMAKVNGLVGGADVSPDEFRNNVSDMIDRIKLVSGMPDFVYLLTTHTSEEGKLTNVTFTLKLRKRDRLKDDSLKRSTGIIYGAKIYERIASVIADWADNRDITVMATQNVDALNQFLLENVPNSKVDFAYGTPFVTSISDDKMTIGLTDAQAASIAELPFFDDCAFRVESSTQIVSDLMDSLTRPVDIVRTKNFFTDTLDLRTRASFVKLIKKAYRKDITKSKGEGVFKYEDDTYFGLITKTEEVPSLDADFTIGEDGFNYYWSLSPIIKETGETLFEEDKKSELLNSAMSKSSSETEE